MSFEESNDHAGNPIVQYAHLSDLTLCCGEVLGSVRIGFCVFGSDPQNPLVVLHPALTGSPRAKVNGKASQGDGWFNHALGSAKTIDTDRFTVICFDHLGGNGASSSARELGSIGERLSFLDEVNLIARFLTERGVDEVEAIIGGSIGGGQALDWLSQDKVQVKKIIDVSGHATNDGKSQRFFEIQRDLLWGSATNGKAVVADLQLHLSDQLGSTASYDFVFNHIARDLSDEETFSDQKKLLSTVRKIGFLRFVTPLFFETKWRGYCEQLGDENLAYQQIDSWIAYQGESFPNRFSAQALALLAHLDATAVAKDPREIAEIISQRGVKLRGFAVEGDVLFPPSQQGEFYRRVQGFLASHQKHLVEFKVVEDYLNGHDHFLTERFINHKPLFQQWLSE